MTTTSEQPSVNSHKRYKPKNLGAFILLMNGRFESGNSIPIERAYIRDDEWEVLRGILLNKPGIDTRTPFFSLDE